MKTYGKFAVLIVAIIGTLVWLAAGGIQEGKTYYKTVAELRDMKDAEGKRLRVAGDVEAGSIVRKGREVEFTLVQESEKLRVVYDGIDPLPDTFRDGAQALADGKLGADGVFRAAKIQAKCASKYEAKPGGKQGAPVYQKKASGSTPAGSHPADIPQSQAGL
ncbi:MAG: cytochrome c maturation protein CcmE [Bryobacteraceae bacterium]|nr:cytochrome c maturation protein CcmE [Bryobacterales bacterium]MEB2361989.1 cytochrome c maturation protein CcmE [Bryobacterales bacterium]NUN01970.1 cytochrome c maturation protein CcmE [Bryobacteraceae bacterium]